MPPQIKMVRWKDQVMTDVKRIELGTDWRELASDSEIWWEISLSVYGLKGQ